MVLQVFVQVGQRIANQIANDSAKTDFTASPHITELMNLQVEKLSGLRFSDGQLLIDKVRLTKDPLDYGFDDRFGETNTIYFLLAYHYALLASSVLEGSRYPKFLMFELPGEVEGKKVADKENFVIEPFIELCKKTELKDAQVIATGSSFQGLKGAHRIELSEVPA